MTQVVRRRNTEPAVRRDPASDLQSPMIEVDPSTRTLAPWAASGHPAFAWRSASVPS
ncbi:MAG TPA: hypothetical protein VGN51_00560 [Acidimicrobiia bacterium]